MQDECLALGSYLVRYRFFSSLICYIYNFSCASSSLFLSLRHAIVGDMPSGWFSKSLLSLFSFWYIMILERKMAKKPNVQSAMHSYRKGTSLAWTRIVSPEQRCLVLLACSIRAINFLLLSLSSLVSSRFLSSVFLSLSLFSGTLHYLVSAAGSLVSLLFSG